MEQITPKLKSWASIIEEQARVQAIQTASMDFVQPYMAVMPDIHYGRGCCVGAVIPTVGAIIPAAVGVDIGCFHGSTKIPLLDGSQAALAAMAERGGTWWVYSLAEDGRVVPGEATALKTREDAELVKVLISGGEEIYCTPDHRFMMSGGTWKQACDLSFNDSLMPLYRRWQTRDGYETVSTGKGNSRLTHQLVFEEFYGGVVPDGWILHHLDGNHFNNHPHNLLIMERGSHSKLHRTYGHSFDNSNPEFQAKRLADLARMSPETRLRKIEVATENITRYMRENPEHFKIACAGNGQRGKQYLEEHGYNHKVISVQKTGIHTDVFCLQVEKYHNFALAAGVFVHNCGMIAVRTQFTKAILRGDSPKGLPALRQAIENAIPLSAGRYNQTVQTSARPYVEELERTDGAKNASAVAPNWHLQLGTLGSGNHFIEVCLDENDNVWLFLHSGSRGVGNKLATKHIRVAQDSCKRLALPNRDLAYLTEGTPEFGEYIRDLTWAQRFAFLNRKEMMNRLVRVFGTWAGESVTRREEINCHHNYTERTLIQGQNVWLSRKGAIDASESVMGLIPGSMGTASYVVSGKGNAEALYSSPHGAGRRFSRGEAKRTFTTGELDKAMKGIEYNRDHAREFLDEIPQAYKPVKQIMRDSEDLVEIRHTLHQVVNVKGD